MCRRTLLSAISPLQLTYAVDHLPSVVVSATNGDCRFMRFPGGTVKFSRLAATVTAVVSAGLLTCVPDPAASAATFTAGLVARNSQRCVSVDGASTANGARDIQYDCVEAANQQWGDKSGVAPGPEGQRVLLRRGPAQRQVPVRVEREHVQRRPADAVRLRGGHQPALPPRLSGRSEKGRARGTVPGSAVGPGTGLRTATP